MTKKMIVGTAALVAGFMMASSLVLAQTSGCIPANCPGPKPTTSGQPTQTNQHSNTGQSNPIRQSAPKSKSEKRGKQVLPPSR